MCHCVLKKYKSHPFLVIIFFQQATIHPIRYDRSIIMLYDPANKCPLDLVVPLACLSSTRVALTFHTENGIVGGMLLHAHRDSFSEERRRRGTKCDVEWVECFECI